MTTYKAITSFNEAGYNLYGRHFLDSFRMNWPGDIKLTIAYQMSSNAIPWDHWLYKGFEWVNMYDYTDLNEFKTKFASTPEYNGVGVGGKYTMKYDAIKFAHKCYALFHETKNCDVAFWLDADIVTHSKIPMKFIDSLLPDDCYTAYLGRENNKKPMYSECGLVAYRVNSPKHEPFMEYWKKLYQTGDLFDLTEWHDSFVYDHVRDYTKVKSHSWTTGLPESTHPFIQKFGMYMDHKKGPRKEKGRSGKNELVVEHNVEYWK